MNNVQEENESDHNRSRLIDKRPDEDSEEEDDDEENEESEEEKAFNKSEVFNKLQRINQNSEGDDEEDDNEEESKGDINEVRTPFSKMESLSDAQFLRDKNGDLNISHL